MNQLNYKEVANKLRCNFSFGKWGVKILGHNLLGGRHFIQIIQLNNWTFDTHEITQAMFDDPLLDAKITKRAMNNEE